MADVVESTPKKQRDWFMDVEAYTVGSQFWLKELCIIPVGVEGDEGFYEDEHYNYFIKANALKNKDVGCYNFQLRRHGLKYDFGDYYFGEAIRDVQIKVGQGKVYVKGKEKAKYLSEYFNVVELPEDLCSLKKCKTKYEKCCGQGHSSENCAKRKAYLLREAFYKNPEKLEKEIKKMSFVA